MFGDNTSSSLFANISSTNGPGLFPMHTTTSSSSTFSSLFFPAPITSSTLFGLPPTPRFSSPPRPVDNTPITHYTDLDAPIPERSAPTSSRLGDRSPTHWPAIKLSRLPAGFNRKQWLHQHFQRFGTVIKIICQPSLDVAYVAFENAAAAQSARRHGHEPPPLSASGDTLPSTVLLTFAQCRVRPKSGATGQELFSTHITDSRPQHSNVKRKLGALTNERSVRKTINQSPLPNFASLGPSDTMPSSNLFPSNVSTTVGKSTLFAATVEERASILQAHYIAQRKQKPLPEPHHGLPIELTPSDMGISEESFDLRFPAIRGTCPDMCPELERYLREAHQRVSVFECLPSSLLGSSSSCWQMDHTRAVKDYERSSADQPVPLPCELRPTPVLQRTMAYLLASIADRPELDTSRNLWKPWYEFMWTRTRAIRKDVAQQRLCCPIIVNIMECIARFHIFCAARLVDQPIDSFDPRINSENLTQCLQTLKEMYTDLSGTETSAEPCCPHEAEFRAYMLLMNLNDQGALNEVQQLPSYLLRSTEIRFAVSVHESVTTNNYIRFFRLAHQATCLMACLMHRYFVQMRTQALIRLASSFAGHPKKDVQYPVSTITRQLAFENAREAKAFCEHWGLATTDEHIIFDKQTSPQPPELPWREQRALCLIEQKRSGIPLSDLFHNGPVAAEHAQPLPVQSSFDQNGRFIPLMEDEFDQSDTESTPGAFGTSSENPLSFQLTPSQERTAPTSAESLSVTLLSNNEALMGFLFEWFDELLDFRSIAQECLVEETVLVLITGELIEQVIQLESTELAQCLLRAERQPIRSQIAFELREALLADILYEECYRVARTCLTWDSLYRELLEQEMLPSIITSVVRTSFLSAQADAFHRCCLVRGAFRKFRAWMLLKKADEERERALIRSMPACPALGQDALSMMGPKVWDLVHFEAECASSSSLDSNYRFRITKRMRFSPNSANMNEKLTWQAIPPSAPFVNFSLGICSCSTLPESPTFSTVVLAWLRAKLANFRLIAFRQESWISVAHNMSALICVGYPDESLSQYLSEQRLHTLVLIPSNWLPVDPKVPDSSTMHFVVLPSTPSREFIPSLTWTALLHDGLHWLHSNLNATQKFADKPPKRRSPLLPFRRVGHLRLAHFVSQIIDLRFFKPLAWLSHLWRKEGLVDPSPISLFDAYRSVLKRLSDEAPRMSKFDDRMQSTLQVPDSALKFLNGIASWDSLSPQWSLFMQHLELSPATDSWVRSAIAQSELAFQRNVNRTDCLPLPELAPWLHVCVATVHDLLDRWVRSDTGRQPIPSDLLDCWLPLLSDTNDESLFDEMLRHFLKLGQPCMSYSNAVAVSLDSDLRRRITSSLININPPSTTIPSTKTTDPVRAQLDALCVRMRMAEDSMEEMLNETQPYSRTSISRSS